jgi:predicted membrane-bound mannosyltransferase
MLTAAFFYTDAFRHPQGILDAVRTYFVYETGEGHDKPFGWYFQLLVLPQKSGGMWWFGTPLVLLALWAFAATFRKTDTPEASRTAIRFLTCSAGGHFLIYGLISYKNPWLACLPWAHVCVLAGFSVSEILNQGVVARVALTSIAALCAVTQFQQARAATGRLASDERNPFAYVPTRRDVEDLESWLVKLRAAAPAGSLEPVAVTGGGYWPLPWYLRSFDKIGYWREPPADIAEYPVVFAMPEAADAVKQTLASTHVELPRGLRSNVPVILHVRNDIWENWMKHEDR